MCHGNFAEQFRGDNLVSFRRKVINPWDNWGS